MLVLISALMDNRVRGPGAAAGEERWSELVAALAISRPAVFTYKCGDHMVLAIGGNSILMLQVGDQVVARRLGD